MTSGSAVSPGTRNRLADPEQLSPRAHVRVLGSAKSRRAWRVLGVDRRNEPTLDRRPIIPRASSQRGARSAVMSWMAELSRSLARPGDSIKPRNFFSSVSTPAEAPASADRPAAHESGTPGSPPAQPTATARSRRSCHARSLQRAFGLAGAGSEATRSPRVSRGQERASAGQRLAAVKPNCLRRTVQLTRPARVHRQ